ncbi:LacI family DNA-binding transcriptional regulator [Fictibacillus aquaticus]|uniref:LacI family transcriptional regulator n=1 Tax=Fictibacillus aquaticus TaxID=2021314 RepID=A0A235F9B8_9BACL|nr:LacI family DNA-binding transcriptional regulator [Fictibacillus aquaticus]OYD57852.1 LacI family transcriptional regulator [Fictibacillus aquaticus]
METKPNIQAVARLANVSIATVSRVINGQGGVRKKTEDRILKAIDELGYIRNAAARTMKKKETKTVGVIVPDIKNPFFPIVMAGIEQKAREKGYFTILSSTNESQAMEENIVKNFIERGVDGVIITTANENSDHLKVLQVQGIPIVAVDRSIKQLEADTVLVDNEKGTYEAVSHLISEGHEKIAIICGPLETTPAYRRLKGYKRALNDHNIMADERYIIKGNFQESSGYKGTRDLFLLDERPTAIFSSNNLMSLGCIKAMQDLNWKLGNEVSFIGFDDIDIATLVNPKLTVVSRPMNLLGELAFQLLHERMSVKDDLPKREYILSPELKIRDSCRLI